MLKQGVTPIGVAFLFWSDEHEKTEEKTKREIESSGIDRLDGSESSDVQESAWGD
ncbi:hypothetical protein [Saccharococcus caldoxylosilyticus]|uniref:Uncharacterized protein n=1 Tax=Saccharococcus caldoxylosilyticus TaxID=81408 RepID=A0A150L6G6_9BACL|nr:hypothetical protein [Parageobacillus caldoxylosilyticus]KYD07649.1 hypothetical protein B4119_3400 [Parageobacillus caldoxylosilyticus]